MNPSNWKWFNKIFNRVEQKAPVQTFSHMVDAF